jgi:hypothetical protein
MNDGSMTLPGESLLLTISQLALGLAGFSGIVGVFREKSSGGMERQDFMGLRLIIELTLAAVFLAQVPSILLLALESIRPAIRYSSLLLSIFLVTFYVREAFIMKGEVRKKTPPRHPKTFKLFGISTFLIGATLILNAFWWLNIAPYVVAVLFLLVAAGRQFFSLVYERAGAG